MLVLTAIHVLLHLRICFDHEMAFPEQVSITPAKVADKKELGLLIVEDSDAIHVLDRGYVGYQFLIIIPNGRFSLFPG